MTGFGSQPAGCDPSDFIMNFDMKKMSPFLALILLLCTLLFEFGCQGSQQIGVKPGDEMNPALSEQQKALINEHKNRPVH